jgi:hypothetical protein
MAVTAGRPAGSHERAEQVVCLATRVLAVAEYAAAVVVVVTLLAPVLQREEEAATGAGTKPANVYAVRRGDALGVVAA